MTAPVIGELIRKINSPWRPTGDDAIFAVHAHDVFSTHPQLLGTYSVVTANAGTRAPPVYHLGPMVLWVLAIPERLFTERLGIAIGAAIVNVVCLVATVLIVRRLSNDRIALATSGALALMVWSVGHTTLAEPWNPFIGLWALPLLCALALALMTGRAAALVGLAVVGSFSVQAHYLFLGPVAAVVVVAGISWGRSVARGTVRRPSTKVLVTTSIAAVVCWTPTIVQQLFGDPGNLASWIRVTRTASSNSSPFWGYSVRFVVNVVGVPPAVLRGPFNDNEIVALAHRPTVLAWASCTCLVIALGYAAVRWRSRSPLLAHASALALAVLVGTTFTVSRYPRPDYVFPYYRLVMLWFAAGFAWFVFAALLVDLVRIRGTRVGYVLAIGAAAAAVLAVVGSSPAGPVEELDARATAHLVAGVGAGALERERDYVIDGTGYEASFVAYGVFRELRNDGYRVFVPPTEVQLRRDYSVGDRSATRLVVHSGLEPVPEGARVLAEYDDRTPAERSRYDELRRAAASGAPAAVQAFEQARFSLEQDHFVLYVLAE